MMALVTLCRISTPNIKKGCLGSFVVGALVLTSRRVKVPLSTGVTCWRSQAAWGSWAEGTRDCKYEDTNSRFAIFMQQVKYTTPDGIEDKQMYYFYIILAQINYMLAKSFNY